ncbi:MAG: helix-turn-helix domain-containing protein [Spirochaetia bacterium]|nr:helix-turn-helix domain-containing protein [Spirochaetia bacterium]
MIETFAYFGAGCACLIAMGQLFRGLTIRNVTLSLFFFCVGAVQLTSILLFSGEILKYPDLLILHIFLAFAAGPLLFLYFASLLDDAFRFRSSTLLHFVLPGVSSASFLSLRLLDSNALRTIVQNFLNGGAILKVVSIGAGLVTIAYLAFLSAGILLIWKPERSKRSRRLIVAGLALLALLSAGLITSSILFGHYSVMNLALSILVIGFYCMGQKWTFLMNQISAQDRERLSRSLLAGIDLENLSMHLHQLMVVEKIYCDEDLNLPRLAGLLEVSSHQLSQYLNDCLKKNFATYVNEFRIAEACRMLLNEPQQTTLSIGLAVGFNSNSVFHSAFTKIVGMPPGRFRKSTA